MRGPSRSTCELDIGVTARRGLRSAIAAIPTLVPRLHRNLVFCVDLAAAPIAAPKPPEDYRFEYPASLRTVDDERLRGVGISAVALREREELGDRIGLIAFGDEIVHRSLLHPRGRVALEGDRGALTLRDDAAYISFCETAPAHRGRGLYAFALRSILAAEESRGEKRYIIIACRADNAASIRGIQRAGFGDGSAVTTISALNGRFGIRRWTNGPPSWLRAVSSR